MLLLRLMLLLSAVAVAPLLPAISNLWRRM